MQQITKKIESGYIVWFQETNRWIHFEEPAWFVNKLFKKGYSNIIISNKLSKKYKVDIKDSLQFVNKICQGICEAGNSDNKSVEDTVVTGFDEKIPAEIYSVKNYLIGNKKISIEYGSQLAEYYIHPPITHLETEFSKGESDIYFKIVEKDIFQFLKVKNGSETSWVYNDFNRLKKRLFINMVNIIYNKTTQDWLSFVHASAVSDGKQTILLSSASGSGKSTMAALLQAKGLQVVADDFVPIDVKTKKAYPFPTTISIKKGTLTVLKPYIRDSNKNIHFFPYNSTCYLSPYNSPVTNLKAKPVKHIVFIRYNPNKNFNFNKVSIVDALKLFHEQAWVSDDPGHAKVFINWFVKLQFYSLEYGNTELGIDKILKFFK